MVSIRSSTGSPEFKFDFSFASVSATNDTDRAERGFSSQIHPSFLHTSSYKTHVEEFEAKIKEVKENS